MGKESDEYLVGGLEPRPLYAVLSQLTHALFAPVEVHENT